VQIVRHDRTLEQIVFPIPEICEYITSDTKVKILNTAERDDQGSKVSDFFERTEDMFNEMKWQKKLRGKILSERTNTVIHDCNTCQCPCNEN
jgi:inositol 1,4,5-triphosphate receptor type 1